MSTAPRGSRPRLLLGRLVLPAALFSLSSIGVAQVAVRQPVGDVATGFEFTADGAFVISRGDLRRAGVFELLQAPADASAPAVRLNATLVPGGDVVRFALSAAGRVVYLADQDVNDVFELYSVPVTGGTPIQLNDALVAGGDVLDLHVTADGTRVIYLADAFVDGLEEFFGVPADGSTPPVALDPVPSLDPVIHSWLQPDGTHLFFTRRAIVVGPPFGLQVYRDTLFVLDLVGSPNRVELAAAHFSTNPFVQSFGSSFQDLQFTPDGQHIVFTDYVEGEDGPDEIILRSTAIDGSQTPVALSQGTSNFELPFEVGAASNLSWRASRTSSTSSRSREGPPCRVAYLDRRHLYSIASDGSDRRRLDPTGWTAGWPFALSPDGDEVYYYAWKFASGTLTGALLRSPADGSLPATFLDLRPRLTLLELIVADTRVIYRATTEQVSNPSVGLYSVPRDGSQANVLLNGPVLSGPGARFLTVAPGERVLYQEYSSINPLHVGVFVVPSDGSLAPRRISAPQASGHFVSAYQLSPDGERAAYRANQRVDETHELFATTVSGGAEPIPYYGLRIGLP